MAILATRRKWLVTSLCAALLSPCSRQRLASMNSSCGSSRGNLRISWRYRLRLPSGVRDDGRAGRLAVAALIAAPLSYADSSDKRAFSTLVARLLNPSLEVGYQ